MKLPQPKPPEPASKPYSGVASLFVEVVPLEPYTGEKVPPPSTPPKPAAAREAVVTDLVRAATEAYYGNACYYHRVLRANGFSGLEVFGDGDEVVMPARAKTAAVAEAERWRARLAEKS